VHVIVDNVLAGCAQAGIYIADGGPIIECRFRSTKSNGFEREVPVMRRFGPRRSVIRDLRSAVWTISSRLLPIG
jgi:hypothetical protein